MRKPQLAQAKVAQDLGADAVVAQVDGEAEMAVGLDGVESVVLQLIGEQLVGQPDAPTLLAHVKDDSPAFGLDSTLAATASCSPQSHRREPNASPVRHSECTRTSGGRSTGDGAPDQRDMVFVRRGIAKGDRPKRPSCRRQRRFRAADHDALVKAAIVARFR